jgi:DNA-binding MarR family transcriptional regulator
MMRDRSTSVNPHPVDRLPEQATNVLFDVWLLSRATSGVLDAALAPVGLTADEFGIYSVLTSTDAMTPTELARWMSAPPTTVSSAVRRLEGRGHVERRRNPDDGRSYVLGLTPAGRRAHAAGVEAFAPVLGRVQAALGSKEASVRRALGTVRDAVDRAGAAGG